ncbi:odorant receptor 9a-like [Leptopilina boulardi]|uniref:odorant receptor 9a-like n=1 Tax=Leptopilina boulardi TaxID=63433 RepID=UPI0021F660D6|nr:odorant receptor 9a-like [Leptopilina boulardi]
MFISSLKFIFYASGMWRSTSLKKNWKHFLYNIYIIFSLINYFLFTILIFIYLLNQIKNVDKFTESLFYFTTAFANFIKIISFTLKNKTILEMQSMFSNKICQSRDNYESQILDNVSKTCRANTIIFQAAFYSAGMMLFLTSFDKNGNISLILNTWTPNDINNSKLIFFIFYFYQTFGLFMTLMILLSSECFAMIIVLQIGGQLDIFVHRLNLLSAEKNENSSQCLNYRLESKIIGNCVKHHNYIFAIGDKLNDLFGLIIFVQFFASMVGLCGVIFQLSRISNGSWLFLVFLGSLTLQTFIYNLYGETLIKKSLAISNEIWKINWFNLRNTTKKDLNMIAIRASRPIEITGSSIIVMSFSTFVKVIKSAYSIFNLLNSFS